MLYIVEGFEYEQRETYILTGPEVEDWQEYCKSLMLEVLKAAKTRENDLPISENDLVWGLVQVLLGKGYQPCIVETASFCTDVGFQIANNEKIKAACSEEYGEQVVNELLEYNKTIRSKMK